MSFILAAPTSGAGKTTITLGLLRALTKSGHAVRAAKSGPDYIDPRFHAAACEAECVNLDAWAMSASRIRALATGETPLIIEGAMGLFDGAPPDGRGATADLARVLDLPVILVVDAARMSQSVAPLVAGFADHDPHVRIRGIILNRIGSDRHERMLRNALAPLNIPVLGAVPRRAEISLPSRHLGLVQAAEVPELEKFLQGAAEVVRDAVDLTALADLLHAVASAPRTALWAPAQRISVARDDAFAFTYPHQLQAWRDAGANLSFFSPLQNEAVPDADLIFLPGGYPELHAGRIANADRFIQSLKDASKASDIYGECGGYMVLGEALTDADGHAHRMTGLLRLETSFRERKLHLGYRHLLATDGRLAGEWRGHEFHYATTTRQEGRPLFSATDAEGNALAPMGLRAGRVSGSFAHLIERDASGH